MTTLETIITHVAKSLDLTPEQVSEKCSIYPRPLARQIVSWIAVNEFFIPQREVAEALGYADQRSVRGSAKKWNDKAPEYVWKLGEEVTKNVDIGWRAEVIERLQSADIGSLVDLYQNTSAPSPFEVEGFLQSHPKVQRCGHNWSWVG